MNMRVLSPSRKQVDPGDIFVYRIKGHPYGFGRVIRTDCLFGGSRGTLLLYIYDAFSSSKGQIPELSKTRLLLPPLLTNRLAWSEGYFETIMNRPLQRADVLRVHCFYTDTYVKTTYVDEDENCLPKRSKPCDLHALHSFRTIDAAISIALGIQPAPDTVPPPPPPLDEIIAGVAKEFNTDASRWVRGGRGDPFARSVAAWLARYRFNYTADAIAEALGYSGARGARQAIRRIDRERERLSAMLSKLGHRLEKGATAKCGRRP